MIPIIAKATVANLLAALDELGIERPSSMLDQLAEADRLAAWTPPAGPSLSDAIADAVARGVDPLKAKEVQAAATREQIARSAAAETLRQRATELRVEAVLSHADYLTDELAEIVDEAEQVLAPAREKLGPTYLPTLLNLDPRGVPNGASASWYAGHQQVARLRLVATIWRQLHVQLTESVAVAPPEGGLILADLGAAGVEEFNRLGQKPEAVAGLDVELSLATPEEFAARRDRVLEERQADRDEAQEKLRAGITGRSKGEGPTKEQLDRAFSRA